MGSLNRHRCCSCRERDFHTTVSLACRLTFHFVKKLTGMWRFQLVTGRVWRGTAFGGVKGRTELPGIVEGQG